VSLSQRFLLKASLILLFSMTFQSETTSAAPQPISDISVEGTKRLEKATVLNFINVEMGEVLDESKLDEALKKLYATGYFADVVLEQTGGLLKIKVVENPTINRIVYEGNKAVSEKILNTDMKLKPRMMYAKHQIQREVQRLLAIYRLKGYFGARVTPQLIKREQNRVDIVFEIEEGDATKIEAIRFVGNKEFSGWDLSGVIGTKESIWWKFFSTDDVYDPDRVEMDKELLRKYYLNHGYVDFKVLSATAELLPKQDAFVITFFLEEGQQYKVSEIKIENKLKHIPTSDLEKIVSLKKGDWYSAEEVEYTVEAMSDKISTLGYAFVDVTPIPNIDSKTGTISITFKLEEGPKIFINRINIGGNVRTIDTVIRREFLLAEGDAFNASRLRSSDRRLNNLGFFKKIDIDKKTVNGRNDLVDINVNVEEQPTGDISFSAGFSTTDGPLGMIKVSERNLFGRAYEVSSALQMAKRSKSLNVDFVNPYFLDRNLAWGVGGFVNKVNRKDTSSYNEFSIGARTSIGYSLSRYVIQRWTYSIAQHKIENVSDKAFPLIKNEAGKYISSTIGHEISYDRLDNRFAPTNGYILRTNNDFTGVGGNVRYLKNTISGAVYYSLLKNVVLGIDAQAGMMNPIGGRRIRISDKFLLGGQSLRGFDYGGVGPHSQGTNSPIDKKNGFIESDALGGDMMFTTSAEIRFPLGLPEDFAISGHVFVDAGTLWDTKLKKEVDDYNKIAAVDKRVAQPFNSKNMRAAVGIGISWASPMGMIGIDYGYPILKQKGDETRNILINFGAGKF
jgi:outer membrane protein insertion porin family